MPLCSAWSFPTTNMHSVDLFLFFKGFRQEPHQPSYLNSSSFLSHGPLWALIKAAVPVPGKMQGCTVIWGVQRSRLRSLWMHWLMGCRGHCPCDQCREEDRLLRGSRGCYGAMGGPDLAQVSASCHDPQNKARARRITLLPIPLPAPRGFDSPSDPLHRSHAQGAFAVGRRADPGDGCSPSASLLLRAWVAPNKGSFHPGCPQHFHATHFRSCCPQQTSTHRGQALNSVERD